MTAQAPAFARAAPPTSSDAAISAWRRRSRLIRFWRRALPALLAVIVIANVSQLAARGLAAGNAEEIAESEIRIVNPRFLGRDQQGRAFVVEAREALRPRGQETLVRLTEPRITLQDAGGPILVRSQRGVWREQDEVAILEGQVVLVDQQQGTTFRTEGAVVETRVDRVSGNTPIEGTGPTGRVSAQSYAIYDRGDRVVLRGAVRIHMNNGGGLGSAGQVGLR